MYTELRVKKIGRRSWVLLDKWVTQASILHDYYYVNAIRTKHYADRAFRKVAKHYGASKIEYTLAYHGVRLIGRGSYQ